MTQPGPMAETLVIRDAAIATVDTGGTEYERGHLVAAGGRISAVGPGPPPPLTEPHRTVDGSGCLLTPGLVNTHHHLYQWATRGRATDHGLFDWLTEMYPLWTTLDEASVAASARAGLAWLALTGCTTSTDHHYVFPAGTGDLLGVTIAAARDIGVRFHPGRGSMDLGRSAGGLPPDEIVEDLDTILSSTQDAIDRYHDPRGNAMVQVAVAPCSPFTVTSELLRESARLARANRVRLHTPLAESTDEAAYYRDTHGSGPVKYLDSLGWLGPDVWLAHAVHLPDGAARTLAATGTSVAHCPSSNARLGTGPAPVPALLEAGVAVGLGVDGPASQECGMLVEELRQALYTARLRDGAAAMSTRKALELGTLGGARCLGRDAEIGTLETGKLADLALWRLDGLGQAGIPDPVAALVLGPPAPLKLLIVGGVAVVADGELVRGTGWPAGTRASAGRTAPPEGGEPP